MLLILLIIMYLFDFIMIFVQSIPMALPAIGHQGQGGVICCFLTSIPTGERPPPSQLSVQETESVVCGCSLVVVNRLFKQPLLLHGFGQSEQYGAIGGLLLQCLLQG